MEGQPRIEELLNKITFLQKALEFYASKKTYSCINGIAPIDNDRGHQASFALEQTEEIQEYNQSIIDELKKNVNTEIPIIGENPAERMISLQKIINEVYKKIDKYGSKNV